MDGLHDFTGVLSPGSDSSAPGRSDSTPGYGQEGNKPGSGPGSELPNIMVDLSSFTDTKNDQPMDQQLQNDTKLPKVDDFFMASTGMNNGPSSAQYSIDDESSLASPGEVANSLGPHYHSGRIRGGIGGGLSASLMNTRSASMNNQLGTSLNNLISPSSTYDGFMDSPYGSFQGSINDNYLQSPMNSPAFRTVMSKEGKLSRRRELHNAVERRRRDLIKEKIRELGALVPPVLLFDAGKHKLGTKKEIRANKSTILRKSVEYIRDLQLVLRMQEERKTILMTHIEMLSGSRTGSPDASVGQSPGASSQGTPSVAGSAGNVDTFGMTPVRTYSNAASPFGTNTSSPFAYQSPASRQGQTQTQQQVQNRQQAQQAQPQFRGNTFGSSTNSTETPNTPGGSIGGSMSVGYDGGETNSTDDYLKGFIGTDSGKNGTKYEGFV